MCNDYGNHVAYAEYAEAFASLAIPIVAPLSPPNLEPRDDIWPTELAPVFRREKDGVELAQLRWGFTPINPKGRTVINFRSEGRNFEKSRRCLVPASHFFEFKGPKAPKQKWKFSLRGEEWFCFTGLWRTADDGDPASFTLLTTSPGPDVEPIHNRQMVVLRREHWRAWLDMSGPESELFAPLPAGTLNIDRVR
ncbi:SOS response-associated peptidase [Sphingomonas sp. LY29]|uniref:SOS response-associated peptidase n=1 Tax=Sphingomonas sp. LY29 TaxID=3095341 RepID=UPI003A7F3A5A